MKRMKTIKRVLLLSLTLLLIAATLFSCGKKDAYDSTWTPADTDAETYFSRILLQHEEAREKFTAAARGYDMSAEGFDDSTVAVGEIKEVNLDAARKALQLVKPKESDTVSTQMFNKFCDELTPDQVNKTVMRMSTTVNLSGNGFPHVLLVWVGAFLRLLTNLTGGYYVWALFFFAIVVEIALLYFGIKQQKSSQKQASLKPKEMAIRKKYAGRKDQKSQQALQQELQAFYQAEGVNPLGGCLPLLVQMPILIALYNIVVNPLRYVLGKGEGIVAAVNKFATTPRAAGGLGMKIADANRGSIELLSQIHDPAKLNAIKDFAWFSNSEQVANELADVAGNLPNFYMFGDFLNTGLTPGFQKPYLLLLVPLFTFVAYFFSMKLTRKLTYQPMMNQDAQMGCSNNMMDIMMPLLSVYFAFIMPAAVGIYWIFKCIISTVKQIILTKAMPMPVFTEEDYKRAEREMKGKLRPEERAPLAGRPTGAKKSLHRIDDEDDLPARARTRDYGEEEDSIYERRKKEAAEAKRLADEQAEKRRLSTAKLKEDRKNNKKK